MLDHGLVWLADHEPIISALVGLTALTAASWSIIQFVLYHRKAKVERSAKVLEGRAAPDSAPISVFSTLFNLGLTQRSQLEELVSIRTVNIALFGILLVSFVWMVTWLFTAENVYQLIVHGIVFLLTLIIYAFQANGRTFIARWSLVFLAALYWITIMVGVGPRQGVDFFFPVLLVLPLLLFGRRERKSTLLAVTMIIATLALAVFLQSKLPPMLAVASLTRLPSVPYYLDLGLVSVTLFAIINFYNSFAVRSFFDLEHQKLRNDELINSMLPEYVARRISNEHATVADWHNEATVLIGTIMGFETLCHRISAVQFVELLSEIFVRFDRLVKKHGIEKVNTLDTTYVVATGIGSQGAPDHCAVATFALEALGVVREFSETVGHPFVFRAGISTGQVVSGVIGEARPCFDIWGETVELANSMRNTAIDNSIAVNEPAYWRLRDRFDFAVSGVPESTYLLLRKKENLS